MDEALVLQLMRFSYDLFLTYLVSQSLFQTYHQSIRLS